MEELEKNLESLYQLFHSETDFALKNGFENREKLCFKKFTEFKKINVNPTGSVSEMILEYKKEGFENSPCLQYLESMVDIVINMRALVQGICNKIQLVVYPKTIMEFASAYHSIQFNLIIYKW